MDKILAGLNDVQKRAITTTDKHVLVVAAPGSGKTLLLSRRIAYIIKQGVLPGSILAVTFTNKAAKEMKTRIQRLIGDDINHCWIGTFHGICLRIVAQYSNVLDLNPGFTIIDDKDQIRLVKQAIEDVGGNINDKPDFILNKIGNFKNKLISPQQALEDRESIAHVYARYQELLKENNCLDFDEIQTLMVKLLEQNYDIRLRLQRKFRYIAIDEIQDTCDAQFRIIQLLTDKDTHLFSVGDPEQSIFSFRSANIGNVQTMQELYDATVFNMEQNYRSSEAIVRAANAVIENNPREFAKEIWTENPTGLNLVCYAAGDENDEANFVTTIIQATIDKEPTRTNSDFTILYRTNAQSRAIEESLLLKGIPYQLIGNVSFFQRKEVKDMIAYLKVVANKYDSLALTRIINVPKRNIGETTIKKLVAYADQHNILFHEALQAIDNVAKEFKISKKTVEAIKDFNNSILKFREFVKDHSIIELIQLIWHDTQYIDILYSDGTEDSAHRVDNLREFYTLAANHTRQNPHLSIEEFLNSISLFTDQDSIKDTEVVKLMTVHTSKGLEFPIVFIVGLEDGTFPHFKSIGRTKELEEERRLFYVALTRAEEKVYLSHSKYKSIMGQPTLQAISRFVKEIPENLIINVR